LRAAGPPARLAIDKGCYIFALLWRPAIYAAGLALLAVLGTEPPALDPWYLPVMSTAICTQVLALAHRSRYTL
jgi:hypothetical protein